VNEYFEKHASIKMRQHSSIKNSKIGRMNLKRGFGEKIGEED